MSNQSTEAVLQQLKNVIAALFEQLKIINKTLDILIAETQKSAQ